MNTSRTIFELEARLNALHREIAELRTNDTRLRADKAELLVVAREIDRWALVIESAVRNDAPRDLIDVTRVLKANAAIAHATTGTPPEHPIEHNKQER